MKNIATVTNASIDSAGLPKDYRQVLAEYIWNGFDAKASRVNIRYAANELGYLNYIAIEDNGEGIHLLTLRDSFGNFLDSLKRQTFQRSSYVKGKKGKGRFSFTLLATRATWETIYAEGNQLMQYDILMERDRKNEYDDSIANPIQHGHTGTKVVLEGIFGVSEQQLLHQDFETFLAKEFGWFLLLNKDKHYALTINDTPIRYEHLIQENDTVTWTIADKEDRTYRFDVNFVRWGDVIGDRYYYYYLNTDKIEIGKELTSFNNNALDFHHSVYIKSSFFNNFERESVSEGESDNLFSELNHHVVYRKLIADLRDFLSRKEKKYIREMAAEKYIHDIQQKGLLPYFPSDNEVDLARKNDLIAVTRVLYCVIPRVFRNLKADQERTLLAFLNLTLQTEKRSQILSIVEQITPLTESEYANLESIINLNFVHNLHTK